MRKSVRAVAMCVVLAACGVCLPASRAMASPILDQSCCGSVNAVTLPSTSLLRVQSFTVGMDGLLSGIAVGLVTGGSSYTGLPAPTFSLYSGAVGDGADVSTFGTPLVTFTPVVTPDTVAATFAYTWFLADISAAGLQVTAGQQFFLAANTGGTYGWVLSSSDQYAGGTGRSAIPHDPTHLASGHGDYTFRSYVDQAVQTTVPEPTSLMLLGTGLIAGGFGLRKRQNA